MEESFTVTLFGKTDHYFMEVELVENKPCETHDYALVNLNKNNPELHCRVCDDKQLVVG